MEWMKCSGIDTTYVGIKMYSSTSLLDLSIAFVEADENVGVHILTTFSRFKVIMVTSNTSNMDIVACLLLVDIPSMKLSVFLNSSGCFQAFPQLGSYKTSLNLCQSSPPV